MANKQFGETLRELRKRKNYTQQQVAELLGLKNKSTLGSWEIGISEPDAFTFLKLLKIYEVNDIYAAFGEVSPNPYIQNYDKLDSKYKKLIDNQIDQLLDIQSKEKEKV